ncbi:uncharacterized protein LOC113297905 isoform X2 [Papaver somniferum]|uniref:uncharacterized protein LOC113297905 isoform X2 n=1 Tax=Papaver somniferum TaxID=3469 RepID=UPI000E6FE944|nr:uncharacterized protein LOC113297905 isoform X2 [Papaver somniferum]
MILSVPFRFACWESMAENSENHSLEGGSGQPIESSNVELLMKSMADLRQHQLLQEERLGILPSRHNSGSTSQTSNQGDLIMPARNQNQFGQLLQRYLKLSPKVFSGSPPDPEEAEEWLQNAEHVLEHVSNDRGTWVNLITFKFRGPSRYWWDAVMKVEGGTMTWNRFKALFIDKYVPDAARDRKFYEFMSLTKVGMSISAYNVKFTRLSRYGAELIATDEAKAKKFIRGLDPEMRTQLSCLRIRIYEDALNRSLDYEKEMEDQLATRIRERPQLFSARQDPAKRPMLSAPNQPYFRPSVRPWSMGSASVPPTISPTTRPPAVRPQGRLVRFQQVRPVAPTSAGSSSFRCHNCGEWGHFRKDCTKKPSAGLAQQGAVYAMEPIVTSHQETSEESPVLYTVVEGDSSVTDQVVEGDCDVSGVDLGEGEIDVWGRVKCLVCV